MKFLRYIGIFGVSMIAFTACSNAVDSTNETNVSNDKFVQTAFDMAWDDLNYQEKQDMCWVVTEMPTEAEQVFDMFLEDTGLDGAQMMELVNAKC